MRSRIRVVGGAPPPPLDFAPQGVQKTQFLTPEDQSPPGRGGGLRPLPPEGNAKGERSRDRRSIKVRRVDSRDEALETGRSSARPPASRRQGPKAGGSTSDPQSRIADPLRGSRCWRPPGIIHHPTTHDPLRKHVISPAGRSTPLAPHHVLSGRPQEGCR